MCLLQKRLYWLPLNSLGQYQPNDHINSRKEKKKKKDSKKAKKGLKETPLSLWDPLDDEVLLRAISKDISNSEEATQVTLSTSLCNQLSSIIDISKYCN